MELKRKIAGFEKHLLADSTGMTVHRNPENGFVVIGLHYTADPAKRSREWVENERRLMSPKQWAVEMERSWETYAGKSVYDKAFFKHLHVLTNPIGANPNYPIFRGWDFGGNQSVAIGQIIGNRLYILDELPNKGLNTRAFAPEVIAYCNQQFGAERHYIDIVDPSAAWEGKTAEGKACTDVMREFDLLPIAAATNDPQKRIAAVTELLMRLCDDGKPALLINPHCTFLIRAFEGGYHYPEKPAQGRKMDRPVKNLFSHISDCTQYLAIRMKSSGAGSDEESEYERSITTPRYIFTK